MSIFVKHLSQWSIPTFLETGAKAIIMMIAAFLLPKEDFGILTVAMLVFTYHVFLQFGIVDGLIIKLPGWFVEKKNKEFLESLKISLTYIVSIIFLLIFIIFIYFFFSDNLSKAVLIGLIYATSTIPYQIYNHYLLLNRYRYEMNITVYARMTMVLSRLIIQIPLIYFFGIFGLAFGELFIYTFSAIFIKLLSKSSLSPYINFKYFKKYLTYGLPIFFISLVGILASTIERLIGTYYFNLEAIAEIGMLAFIGSLFIIITGQILSLFSQYSREYLIKTNDSEGLLGVYFVFTKMMLFFYSIFASIFYMILKSFIIPAYLTEYTNIIDYFVLIYLIFLIRISISILINWMLITGERLKIAYSSLLFCVIAIASALAISLKFDFTMEYLFFTVIVAALMQLGFLLFHCLNLSDIRGGRFWLIITLSLHILLPFLMIQNQHIEWLYFIYISVFTHLVINIYFIKVKNSYGHIKKTLFILRRKYE